MPPNPPSKAATSRIVPSTATWYDSVIANIIYQRSVVAAAESS